MPVWDIEITNQFIEWWEDLTAEEQESIRGSVNLLKQGGPGLGRPAVDTVTGSRHAHVKELRAGTIRVLFAFNPMRAAILLIGDKRDRWQAFYTEIVPLADDLLDEHLQELESEEGAP
jgi:hypothetical protein